MSVSYQAKVRREARKVALVRRSWDGIDRPDYDRLLDLSPDDARYLGQQLMAAAEEIDGKSKRDRTQADIEKATKRIISEARASEQGPW